MTHRVLARKTLLGAVFLMATSAIGPGFLTQTALFTSQLGASFGFAILVSILIDIGAQLNIWRIITVSGRRTQDIGNLVRPGLGTLLSVLVAVGGFAFNVGNIAGCALGMNVLFGLHLKAGAALSAAIAATLFLLPQSRPAMDRFAVLLGLVMIGLTLYVATIADPPVGEAVIRSVYPAELDALVIVTLVGGTVGGYITFAGAHRLLDAGTTGPAALPAVSRSATSGILITGCMRVLLFMAALGVVANGGVIDTANPPASIFRLAAGAAGYTIFGAVMWCAAITSVVGASYTSTSFVKTLHPALQHERITLVAFVIGSALVFLMFGRPVRTLVVVGALNALVLPVALVTLLVATRRASIVGPYQHPGWLTAYGVMVAVIMAGLAAYTVHMAL